MGASGLLNPPIIRDIFESQNVRVDRENSIIHGVKILGLVSANGRSYSKSAISQAKGLYENRQVNVDHPKRANDPRVVADRFGKIINVREEADGLYGDLPFLKSHPLADMICETAERMPELLGLSHNSEGKLVTRGGKQVVESISRVRSIDVVADAATTRSLFEGEGMDPSMETGVTTETPPASSSGDTIAAAFKTEINKVIDGDGDVGSKIARIKDLLKSMEQTMQKLSGEATKPESKPAESTEEGVQDDIDPTLSQLQEQINRFQLREEVRDLFEAAGFKPDKLQLEATILLPTAEKRKALVESLAKGQQRRPRSAGPMTTSLSEAREESTVPKTAKEFAALLK